jgi:hypothetical protein
LSGPERPLDAALADDDDPAVDAYGWLIDFVVVVGFTVVVIFAPGFARLTEWSRIAFGLGGYKDIRKVALTFRIIAGIALVLAAYAILFDR